MEAFGRADAVDDLDAEAVLPAQEDVRGQRLARGDAQAEGRQGVARRRVLEREHRGVEGGAREEQRRTVAGQHLEGEGRRHALRVQDALRAHAAGK